jgi:hypothetical protein
MPRSTRKITETPESRALDETARKFDEVEAQLYKLREQLVNDAVLAVRAGLPVAEAARRAKYSREHLSRLIAVANERDGWVKPE